MTPLFAFRPRAGERGRFEARGNVPELVEVLADRGERLDESLFAQGDDEP